MISSTIRHLVAIVPPGGDDPSVRLDFPDQQFLKRIVTDLETVRGVNSVTIHSTTTGRYQVQLINCHVDNRGVALALGGKQYQQHEFPDEIRSVAAGLAVRVAHHLPDCFGVEIVTYDPVNIGVTAVPTTRLLATNDDVTTLRGTETEYPIATLLEEIAERSIPHLFGLEIDLSAKTETYPVEVRFATFRSVDRWSTPVEFTTFVDERSDIATRFKDPAIVSNYQLPQIHDWDVREPDSEYGRPVLGHSPQEETAEPQHSLKPLRSPIEYWELLGRPTESLDDIYRELGYLPQIPVPKTELESIVELPANEGVQNPWPLCDGRDEPLLRTRYILREATGTEQHLDERPHPTAATKRDIDIEGTLNTRLAERCACYFRDQGEQITARPDLCAAIAFERQPKSGPSSIVVVGSRETLAAGTLVAIATAVETTDRTLTVCVPSTVDAHWVGTVLSRPFFGTAGPWTGLYSVPQCAIWTEETIPFVPDPTGDLKWMLNQDRTLAVACDDQVLARGPARKPPTILEGAVPEYHVATQEIHDPEDGCIETNVSPTDLATRGQVIPWPALIARRSYLKTTAVFRQKKSSLVPATLQGQWHSPQLNERNKQAATTFLSQFTREQAGATLPMAEIVPRFLSWLRRQTSLRPPDPAAAESSLHTANGDPKLASSNEPLRNRTWQYPVLSEPPLPDGLFSSPTTSSRTPPHPATIVDQLQNQQQSE